VSADRGRRWPWEVNPDRPSLDASERGDHLRREALAQEGHRSLVGEGLDDRVDRVGTALALGDEPAEWALIGLRASRRTALEVGEQPLGDRGGLGLVGDRDVDHPVSRLHVERTDPVRLDPAEPASFDHGGAAHAQGDIQV